ncbi:MAG: tol-pal system protein YbgF [Candidatus Latescibacterota bacterium]
MLLLLGGVVIFLFQSCATKKYVLALHNESMEQNKRQESRLVTLQAAVATIDSLTQEQNKFLLGIRALVGTQSDSQHQNLSSLTAQMENINYQLNELNRTLKAIQLYGGVEPPPAKSAAPADSSKTGNSPSGQQPYSPLSPQDKVNPQEIYDNGMKDFQNKDYEMATNRFVAFLLQFPDHNLAGNAQFWLGESDYAQKKYDLAISDYEKVIKNYPESPKVPAAYLKMGFAQIENDNKKDGIAALRLLIKKFPKSEEAATARKKLR